MPNPKSTVLFGKPSKRESSTIRSALSGSSIWSAALSAVGCVATGTGGSSQPIEWQPARNCLKYTAKRAVIVEPFGISLKPGETLAVRWKPGDTGYSMMLLQSQRGGMRSNAELEICRGSKKTRRAGGAR